MADDITALLESWRDAEQRTDAARMGPLLADGFVGIGPVGFVLDAPAWVGRFGQGLAYEAVELHDVQVHRHGDAAFVVAHQHATGTHGGQPSPADLRLGFSLVADAGAWRIAALQCSFLGHPGGAPR